MERSYFGPKSRTPMTNPSYNKPSNSSGDSLSGIGAQMTRRRKKRDDEQEDNLRAEAKAKNDQYFAEGKQLKESFKSKVAQRRRAGNFKMSSGTPVKYGPKVSERPSGPKPTGQMGGVSYIPESPSASSRKLSPRQRALLDRIRKQRGTRR